MSTQRCPAFLSPMPNSYPTTPSPPLLPPTIPQPCQRPANQLHAYSAPTRGTGINPVSTAAEQLATPTTTEPHSPSIAPATETHPTAHICTNHPDSSFELRTHFRRTCLPATGTPPSTHTPITRRPTRTPTNLPTTTFTRPRTHRLQRTAQQTNKTTTILHRRPLNH